MKRALLAVGVATIASIGATGVASAGTVGAVAGVRIGPANSWAVAVNNNGEVAGDLTGSSANEGFVWHDGKLTVLDSLSAGGNVFVSAIDRRGDVVGEAQAGNGTYHAVEWRDGKLTDLGTGDVQSSAVAINDRGQVIGTSDSANGQVNAAVWRDGKLTVLPGLGGYTDPVAQNEAGLIVGTSQDASGQPHAVEWADGKLVDLGPGNAIAVNDSGQVLVWSYTIGGPAATAFLWHDGEQTRLPSGLWSVTGLNDKGQVVGTSGTEGTKGFVWQHGTLTDLGAVQPWMINDLGEILADVPSSGALGYAVLDHGHAITLSPISGSFVSAATISDTGLVVGQSGDAQSATVWQLPHLG